MWGSALLVAPKVSLHTFSDHETLDFTFVSNSETFMNSHLQNKGLNIVKVYLPRPTTWYCFRTGRKHSSLPLTEEHLFLSIPLLETEQAIFIRAGTILPLLLHNKALSLLRAQFNPIHLQIYPND